MQALVSGGEQTGDPEGLAPAVGEQIEDREGQAPVAEEQIEGRVAQLSPRGQARTASEAML